MQIPVRGEYGGLLSAQELYDATLTAESNTRWGPEERAALRLRTEAEASRSQRLATLIEETKRSVGALL